MRASFPTRFTATLLGKSRQGGSFEKPDDDGTVRKIEYGDAYDLSFESSEGLVQTVRIAVQLLDQTANFDVQETAPLTQLHVEGDVYVNDGRASFKPSKVVKAS